MSLKTAIARAFGSYNYDRRGEELIRKSMELYRRGGKFNRMRAMRISNKIRKQYASVIPPRVELGKNVYFAHVHGIHLGKTTVIGDNCSIYPFAKTLAALKGDQEMRDAGAQRWHARIGNDCTLGADCTIIGPVEIGDDVIIAAGALVTKDVPPHSVVKNVNEIRPKRPDETGDPYHEVGRKKRSRED